MYRLGLFLSTQNKIVFGCTFAAMKVGINSINPNIWRHDPHEIILGINYLR